MSQTASKQTRSFKLDRNVFYILVNNQAGKIEKAILEAVMNSFDAGSPDVLITIESDHISIVDHGKGFKSDDEIKSFFSTIGTPHTEGDAHFGRYRMGRCQGFAYGVNTWRSNTFELTVDVKNHGDVHTKKTGLEQIDGCQIRIDLYDQLTPVKIKEMIEVLKTWIKWLPIPVTVNGLLVSTDPRTAKWTIETDDAYILLQDFMVHMTIYNRGVFVNKQPSSDFGTGGIIVSKPNLDLIYARNAIQTKCPVWRRIKATIRTATVETTRKRGLTDTTRSLMATQLMSGDLDLTDDETLNLKLFTAADKTHLSLATIATNGKYGMVETKDDDSIGALVHAQKNAIVLTEQNQQRFNTTSCKQIFIDIIRLIDSRLDMIKIRYAMGDYALTKHNHNLKKLKAGLESLEWSDIGNFKNMFTTKATLLQTNQVPQPVRSYLNVIQQCLPTGHTSKRVLPAILNGGAAVVIGKILYLDPAAMPDPLEKLDALLRTAMIVTAILTHGDAENTNEYHEKYHRLLLTTEDVPMMVERLATAFAKQAYSATSLDKSAMAVTRHCDQFRRSETAPPTHEQPSTQIADNQDLEDDTTLDAHPYTKGKTIH